MIAKNGVMAVLKNASALKAETARHHVIPDRPRVALVSGAFVVGGLVIEVMLALARGVRPHQKQRAED